ARGLVAPHLLVEGIEQLLPGGRARERGTMEERAAEAPEVEQALRRTVERDAHAIEQEDDRRARLAHRLHGRLVGEEVPAVDGVVEVAGGRVAPPPPVFGGGDVAPRPAPVRALDGDDRAEVDPPARPPPLYPSP